MVSQFMVQFTIINFPAGWKLTLTVLMYRVTLNQINDFIQFLYYDLRVAEKRSMEYRMEMLIK